MLRQPVAAFRLFSLALICAFATARIPAASPEAAPPPQIDAAAFIPVGPTIDLTIHRGVLWSIGDDALRASDLSDPVSPRALGVLRGLGGVRQIVCAGDHAYVTARDEGLYIVDIRRPESPRIVYHYDTLEKATGVAVAPPLLAIANRYHGVELVDISAPEAPRHLSTVLGGKEVQSVDISGRLLLAGVWGERELRVVDIAEPRRPRPVASAPLDGYGDGVRAASGLCLVATGHHSSLYRKNHYESPAPGDSGHGAGHGLEIFSLDAEGRPERLGGVKFPPYYKGVPDTWQVETSGLHAYVADMHNGVYFVDTSAPAEPRIVGRLRLPPGKADGRLSEPAAAAVPGRGHVYVAGYERGIYVARFPAAQPLAPSATSEISPGAASTAAPFTVARQEARYRPEGQMRAAEPLGDGRFALAVGNGGVHVVALGGEPSDFKILSVTPTRGIATDVAARDGRLYVAESGAGLSVWEIRLDGGLAPLGRYQPDAGSVQFVAAPPGLSRLLIQNGGRFLEVLDATDPRDIRPLLREQGLGLFYGKWIYPWLVGDGLAATAWHMGGPAWYDLRRATPARVSDARAGEGVMLNSGMWKLDDGRVLFLHDNGYSLLAPGAAPVRGRPEARLPDNEPLNGNAFVHRGVLFTTTGAWGSIRAVDLRDPLRPALLEKWRSPGTVFRASAWGHLLLVPEGREGLGIYAKDYLRTRAAAAPSVAPAPAPSATPAALPAAPSSALITDLPARLGAETFSLAEGARRCTDRDIRFTEVPAELAGQTAVRINRGEKTSPGSAYAFTLSRPATVYLFVMNNGTVSLDHAWERTSLRARWAFDASGATADTIYLRRFPAGPVSIPAHDGATGGYGIPHTCVVVTSP